MSFDMPYKEFAADPKWDQLAGRIVAAWKRDGGGPLWGEKDSKPKERSKKKQPKKSLERPVALPAKSINANKRGKKKKKVDHG